MTTIADRLKNEYALGVPQGKLGAQVREAKRRGGPPPPKALDGLKPRRPTSKEGFWTLNPEEILALGIDELSYNGSPGLPTSVEL